MPSAEDEAYPIRIARDGTWYHEGAPIRRTELVRLFSTVLRRDEAGDYWLVTPAERGRIEVEDAPFVAVEATSEGAGRDRRLALRLNTDDYVIAGPENMLRIESAADGAPRPYVHVRRGLEALIARPVFYELVELALAEAGEPLGLWSDGAFFPFGAPAA